MVILDTNIIIDHLRQLQVTETPFMKIARKIARDNLAISVITVQELYEGKSTKDHKKEESLLATISPLNILSYTYDIAQLAGEIARDIGRPIEFADASIAATVLAHGASFYTLNKKDFASIKELKFFEV